MPRASACPVSSARVYPAAFSPVWLRPSWPRGSGGEGGVLRVGEPGHVMGGAPGRRSAPLPLPAVSGSSLPASVPAGRWPRRTSTPPGQRPSAPAPPAALMPRGRRCAGRGRVGGGAAGSGAGGVGGGSGPPRRDQCCRGTGVVTGPDALASAVYWGESTAPLALPAAGAPFPPSPVSRPSLPPPSPRPLLPAPGGSHHPPRPCPWVPSPPPAVSAWCAFSCLPFRPCLVFLALSPTPLAFPLMQAPVPFPCPCPCPVPCHVTLSPLPAPLPVLCACPPPLPLAPCPCPGPLPCSVSLLPLPVPLLVWCACLPSLPLALAPRPCPCSLPMPRASWPFLCVRSLALLPAPAPFPGACPPPPLATLPWLPSAPCPAPPLLSPPSSTTRRRSCGSVMPGGVRLGVGGRTGRAPPRGRWPLGGTAPGGWCGCGWAWCRHTTWRPPCSLPRPRRLPAKHPGSVPGSGGVREAVAWLAGAAAAAPCASGAPPGGGAVGAAVWAAGAAFLAGAGSGAGGLGSLGSVWDCLAGGRTGTTAPASCRSSRSAGDSSAHPGETGEQEQDWRWRRPSR